MEPLGALELRQLEGFLTFHGVVNSFWLSGALSDSAWASFLVLFFARASSGMVLSGRYSTVHCLSLGPQYVAVWIKCGFQISFALDQCADVSLVRFTYIASSRLYISVPPFVPLRES